jgi:hypothetical protein
MPEKNPLPSLLAAAHAERVRRLARVFRSTSTPRTLPTERGSVAGALSPGVRDRRERHVPELGWVKDDAEFSAGRIAAAGDPTTPRGGVEAEAAGARRAA